MVENGDEKEASHGIARKGGMLQSGTVQMTAATYAALFTASSSDHIESARNVIRVPAQRPNLSHLPQMSLSSPTLQGVPSSSANIISSTSSDMPPMPTGLLSSGSATHLGNVTADFLPWGPYRPFSAALPGYLPLQAGFLGPKFGGKMFHYTPIQKI